MRSVLVQIGKLLDVIDVIYFLSKVAGVNVKNGGFLMDDNDEKKDLGQSDTKLNDMLATEIDRLEIERNAGVKKRGRKPKKPAVEVPPLRIEYGETRELWRLTFDNLLANRLGEKWKLKDEEVDALDKATVALANKYMVNWLKHFEIAYFIAVLSNVIMTRITLKKPEQKENKESEGKEITTTKTVN